MNKNLLVIIAASEITIGKLYSDRALSHIMMVRLGIQGWKSLHLIVSQCW